MIDRLAPPTLSDSESILLVDHGVLLEVSAEVIEEGPLIRDGPIDGFPVRDPDLVLNEVRDAFPSLVIRPVGR